MDKPKVLFFSRTYHSEFCPFLTSERYESIHATRTIKEKEVVKKVSQNVVGCFEEEFDNLPVAEFKDDYLLTSFSSDRFLRFSSIHDRRRVLGKEISFWRKILDEQKPMVVVNETVAIEISEVLYIECQARGIRYSSWMSFPMGKFYWQSDAMHNSLDWSVFEKEPDAKSLAEADTYIAKVKEGSGKPFYALNVRGRLSLYNIAKSVYWILKATFTQHKYNDRAKNHAIFEDVAPFFAERLRSVVNFLWRRNGYDNLDKYKDLELVFYPLHYEPEAVLFYMGEFFENQLTLIENLAKCLKLNQVLVIKEHPQQAGVLLQNNYRDLKKRVPNLVFLPAEYKTIQLIERCSLLLTLGSTAGVEALILGKPVVVMAKMFYDKYADANAITSLPELREAIRGNKLKYPNEKTLRKFLAQVFAICRDGNPFPHDDLYSEKNLRLLVEGIEDELRIEIEKHQNKR